ncbi:MAG: translation elongation factor Ts [Sedimentisphaerales bacterium]|nr:translation elongation factor Ts [Sedimentisphaerales bacterium]
MAEITASMVKDLRERTGQPMMDCKKALGETGGDVEKAIELLRKKGMAVMEKRSGRDTKEGRIVSKVSADGKAAALAMLCSETDFTSKSDEFGAVSQALVSALLDTPGVPESVEALGELAAPDGRKCADHVNDILSKTGEKTTIGEFAKYELAGPGMLFCYVHFNNKIGTLVQIDAESQAAADHDVTKELAADLAMHITAVNPEALSRADVDPELVAKEREVAAAQVKNKPAEIVDKIVDGKMNKWFQQSVLLEQPFVKDDKKSVGELIDEISKAAGGKLSLKRFARLQIG